jgi:hypothetical protein
MLRQAHYKFNTIDGSNKTNYFHLSSTARIAEGVYLLTFFIN